MSSTSKRIGLIYDAIQEPGQFMEVMLAVAKEANCAATQVVTLNLTEFTASDSQVSDPSLRNAEQAYADYFVTIDPRIGIIANGSVGQVMADQHFFGPHFVHHSEIYNDFMRPNGFQNIAICTLLEVGHARRVGSFLRAKDAKEFTEADLHTIQIYAPHFARAAKLEARLQSLQRDITTSDRAMSHFAQGAIWVDSSLRIMWMNSHAQEQLASRDGLLALQGRLVAERMNDQATLSLAVHAAAAASGRRGSSLQIARMKSVQPWLVSIIPGKLPAEFGAGAEVSDVPHALVLLQKGMSPKLPTHQQLQQLWGLTPAEARLAIGLLQSESTTEYAKRHALSPNTVKTQLKQLFAKTGTNRQATLLQMLMQVITVGE